MVAYRFSLILFLVLMVSNCASRSERLRPASPAPSSEVRYTSDVAGFPILPFSLTTQTGIAPAGFTVVPEEAGFWQAGENTERRWTAERRDGNLVVFHEGKDEIRYATFGVAQKNSQNAFELHQATLFDAKGDPLVTFRADQAIPDLTREWQGRFETEFSLDSHAEAADYAGDIVAEGTPRGTAIHFFRDNMLTGRTPLFSMEVTKASDGSFVLSPVQ